MSTSRHILEVRIDAGTRTAQIEKVVGFLRSQSSHTIFTPNPEMLVKAHADAEFKRVLNTSDLNICDGRGLELISGVVRITGVDFMKDVCIVATKEQRSVFLLGSGSDEVVEKTAQNLPKMIPGLVVAGWDKGLPITELMMGKLSYDGEKNNNIIEKINRSGAEVLFVAFGMGKQERWIAENIHLLPHIRVAVGVGGAFDFISGNIRRAPCFLRSIGLEWMYRWWQQPWRWRRMVNATIVFLWLCVKEKIG